MIDLSIKQIGVLFPAFILVDGEAIVQECGPSLRRLFPALSAGEFLFDHFTSPAWDRDPCLDSLVKDGGPIQLHSSAGKYVLAGAVLKSGVSFLFALSHMPTALSLSEINLNIADFAHSDPIVAAYLQIGVLISLLEETKANAFDLVKERERSLELVSRIKSSAGFLAHDFNNLNSIIELNCLNALKAGHLADHQDHRIRVILDSVNRSIEITKALMVVAKQKNDSGFAEDIDELIRENWPYFRMIAGPRTALISDLSIGPLPIKLSRNGLINCLTSLLMNAREALDGNAGTVSISTRLDRETGMVIIEVADTGFGMDSSVLEAAFEPFFSTKETSNGVGLASVMDFAREMGGNSDLTSVPGEGTQVRIRLPANLGLGDRADEERPLGSVRQKQRSAADGLSILLVEDEPYALEALAELLIDEGYHVVPTNSANAAISALAEENFELLLTDVIMPGTDGMELAKEACRIQPDIRVMLMSGYMPEYLEMRPEWLFIRKPLDVDVLRSLIGSTSESRSERHVSAESGDTNY